MNYTLPSSIINYQQHTKRTAFSSLESPFFSKTYIYTLPHMLAMSGQRHMVFVNIAAAGHMNSTLPLVAELVARGCKVTYSY
jgi:hypothetical protein